MVAVVRVVIDAEDVLKIEPRMRCVPLPRSLLCDVCGNVDAAAEVEGDAEGGDGHSVLRRRRKPAEHCRA